MKRRIKTQLIIIQIFCCISGFAQQKENYLNQDIRGVVIDAVSGSTLPFVTITITDMQGKGATTNEKGEFHIKDIPIGRHNIQASFIGYESNIIRDILLTTSKELYVEIQLQESIHELNEVVVSAGKKGEPLNKLALVGGKMLSVEEASRFAGGLDDPARLVSSFAGVASAPSSNGISVHGNAPHLLQWRLEDIEIPNPNHYADIATLGGGVLSSLSNNVLGNSDFFSGAFPAEYGNAISGVFDMRLRNGNTNRHEHTVQVGILGIDLASEGPINKNSNSSYIINYRYSLTGLMGRMDDRDSTMNFFDYQDLNFKFNFPTKKAGIFSIWGTALLDIYKQKFEENTEKWETLSDQKKGKSHQYMLSLGVTHRYYFNDNTSLKTTVANTYSKYDLKQDIYDFNLEPTPYGSLDSQTDNLIFNTSLNKKFSSVLSNKTGFTYTRIFYKMNLQMAPHAEEPLDLISQGKGSTDLLSAYTNFSLRLSNPFTVNFGAHTQMLTLNKHKTIEPRLNLKWQPSTRHSFGMGYGKHSRMEKIDVYFLKTGNTGSESVNKNLDFTKAHHFMLSYNYRISDDMNLKFEPFFQYLYDVPVMADSSFSVLNRDEFYVEAPLINKGKGKNIGIDITLEKYLSKGYYYLITATLFDSKYCGGDGIWHNTKFNRNYIINASGGKEWVMGHNKNRFLGINIRGTLQGGDRYAPIDEQATMNDPDKDVKYNENKAFSKQFDPMFLLNFTISYRINQKKTSHEISIKMLNATGQKEYFGHVYNYKTGKIVPDKSDSSISNLSYKIEF